MKNLNLAMDDELHEQLRRVAFEDRRSQSDIIREAIRNWLRARQLIAEHPEWQGDERT